MIPRRSTRGRSSSPPQEGPEWICKPGSVPVRSSRAGDGHFSRRPIARPLKRSTRKSMAGRTSPRARPAALGRLRRPAPCLTLLPVGFAEPGRSPGLLVSSYLAVSPLPRGPEWPARRFTFCCTFPGLTAGGRYPPPRPTEPGLSSRRGPSRADMAAQGPPASGHPIHSGPWIVTIAVGRAKWKGEQSPHECGG